MAPLTAANHSDQTTRRRAGQPRRAGPPRRSHDREPARDEGWRRNASRELPMVLAAKHGGAREREELIDAFLPLVRRAARGYSRSTAIDRTDLTQEGVVGLLRALERYDPSRGVPFWAYAAWWVRQAMQQVVSELSRPIVLSDRALRQLARIKEARRRVEQTYAREASCSEIASLAGLPQTQVEKLIAAERRPRSLDERANAENGDAMTVGDQLADPPAEEAYERVPHRVVAAEIPRLLEHLSARERTVICDRFGIGRREHTLREVAERLEVSAERVRQIEQASLEKLYAAAEAT